jgi:uncharacterized protein YjbI with pentapeptide repeats
VRRWDAAVLSGGGGRVTPVTDYLRADLSHSRFEEVDFSQSRFHNAYFQETVIRGAWLQRVEIGGYIDEVTINGVDVGPLIEAELDCRDPERSPRTCCRKERRDGGFLRAGAEGPQQVGGDPGHGRTALTARPTHRPVPPTASWSTIVLRDAVPLIVPSAKRHRSVAVEDWPTPADT